MAPFSLPTRPRRSLPEGYQFGDARPDIREGYGPCSYYRPQNSAKFLVDGFPVCESCNHLRHVHMRGDFTQFRYPVPPPPEGWSIKSTPITSDYATDFNQRSPYTTDRDPGDETPTRCLRRREA